MLIGSRQSPEERTLFGPTEVQKKNIAILGGLVGWEPFPIVFWKALELFKVIFRGLRGSQEVVEALRRARQTSMAARRGPGEQSGASLGHNQRGQMAIWARTVEPVALHRSQNGSKMEIKSDPFSETADLVKTLYCCSKYHSFSLQSSSRNGTQIEAFSGSPF